MLSFLRTKTMFFYFEGFPPPTYVIPLLWHFYGLRLPSSWCFCPRNLPSACSSLSSLGNQVQAGKQSHIPYSQQRPSGPGPVTQGPQQPQPRPSSPSTSPRSASSTDCKPAAGSSSSSAAAVPTKAVPALGEKSSSPLWIPAGEVTVVYFQLRVRRGAPGNHSVSS